MNAEKVIEKILYWIADLFEFLIDTPSDKNEDPNAMGLVIGPNIIKDIIVYDRLEAKTFTVDYSTLESMLKEKFLNKELD